jgi:hypothetical protein
MVAIAEGDTLTLLSPERRQMRVFTDPSPVNSANLKLPLLARRPQASPNREAYRLGEAAYAELGQHPRAVEFHRARAEAKVARDFLVLLDRHQ